MPVVEVCADCFGSIVQVDGNFTDTMRAQQPYEMFQDRASPTGSIGFGRSRVSGRSRVPSPAARRSAFITSEGPDPGGRVHITGEPNLKLKFLHARFGLERVSDDLSQGMGHRRMRIFDQSIVCRGDVDRNVNELARRAAIEAK